MIGEPIIGAVLFVGAIGCAIASSIALSDINRVFREQESPMSCHFGRLRRVQHKYPMLCPGGNRNKKYSRLAIAALVSGFAGALSMIQPNMFGF